MNPVAPSSSTISFEAIDPIPNHEVSEDNIGSTIALETDQQPLQYEVLPPDVDKKDNRLIKENLAIVEANSNYARCGCYCTRTNDDKIRRIKPQEVESSENQKILKPQLRVSSYSSWSGDRRSEYQSSDGGSSKWGDSLISHPLTPDEWSENESDAPRDVRTTFAVSYREDEVIRKSELSEPSRNDTTDIDNGDHDETTSSPVEEDDDTDLPLHDHFLNALVRVHYENKGFFPRKLLSDLVTEDCVLKELRRCLKDTDDLLLERYSKAICGISPNDGVKSQNVKSYKKIFVTLVLAEKVSSIVKFLEEGVSDSALPLQRRPPRRDGSFRVVLRLSDNPGKSLKCFHGWSSPSILRFEEWQWTTIAQVFRGPAHKDVQHDSLPDSMMLPFTTDGRRATGSDDEMEFEGGYGSVFRVEIHPDHHNFNVPKGQAFAIKRLLSRSKSAFQNEVDMLKIFSNDTHPHLISLLATYEQLDTYFFVFPWADGDLNKYWSVHTPKPRFDMDVITWFAQQCEGIAEGLVKIHNYQSSHKNSLTPFRYGRHGDLKPENILWFKDANGGTLKISDFGLSEYSTVHNKSYKARSAVATSKSYRPPECDMKEGKIGQSYDIWTLGCLYLEFITWLLGGWELIKVFEEKRMARDSMWCDMDTDTFFEFVECPDPQNSQGHNKYGARVKATVVEFIQDLHAHASCSDFIHEFLDMIHHEMLLVKPNDPNDKGRIESKQVLVKLIKMRQKVENPAYASTPAVWPTREKTNDPVVELDIPDVATAEALRHKGLPIYRGRMQHLPPQMTLAVPERHLSRKSSYHRS